MIQQISKKRFLDGIGYDVTMKKVADSVLEVNVGLNQGDRFIKNLADKINAEIIYKTTTDLPFEQNYELRYDKGYIKINLANIHGQGRTNLRLYNNSNSEHCKILFEKVRRVLM